MLVRRDSPLVLLDIAIVLAAYTITLVLRFEGAVPEHYWQTVRAFVPLTIAAHVGANHLFGLYRQMWRYASVEEARRVVLAGLVSGALIGVVGLRPWALEEGRLLPLSMLTVAPALALMGFGAVRFQSRMFALRRRSARDEPSRVLLVGAGKAGSELLKDVVQNAALGMIPIGLVDDDPRKRGRYMHGVPVLGTLAQLPNVIARESVDEVLLAIPSATSELVRNVAEVCEATDVPLKVVPSVREVVGGRVTVRDVRDLRIEDLLGRQQVQIDLGAVAGILEGKRVLVTGGGGSIGSEITRQVLDFAPASLALFDHDETHLHDVLTELGAPRDVEAILADIRDQERVSSVFSKYRPQVVFHAAAHKHVPMLETHPEEALFTNVIGTANVADAALAAGSERFVLISTDKAIRPVSVMGASKRFAEQIMWSLYGGQCSFCAVRFGNVLGSRGSVIPTFMRQIQRGGPVTVTHPAMTRYFMSLHEAVQLVLQAAALSSGGEVFTLDMGEPLSIVGLARKMIRLAGRVPGRDVEIKITGPRPGEKMTEQLVDNVDENLPSGHPRISVWRPPAPDRAMLRRAVHEFEALAAMGLTGELMARIKALASGWVPASSSGRPAPTGVGR